MRPRGFEGCPAFNIFPVIFHSERGEGIVFRTKLLDDGRILNASARGTSRSIM